MIPLALDSIFNTFFIGKNIRKLVLLFLTFYDVNCVSNKSIDTFIHL